MFSYPRDKARRVARIKMIGRTVVARAQGHYQQQRGEIPGGRLQSPSQLLAVFWENGLPGLI